MNRDKDLLRHLLAQIFHERETVVRSDVARELGEDGNDPDFRQVWQAARDQVRAQGIVLISEGGGGRYRRGSTKPILRQSRKFRRAALRKLLRAETNAEAALVVAENSDEAQAAMRSAEKSSLLLAAFGPREQRPVIRAKK